jgi:hypothetical protein
VVQRKATATRRARDLRRFLENFIEPRDYRASIDRALEIYSDGNARLAADILATKRMAGLLRKRGVTRE